MVTITPMAESKIKELIQEEKDAVGLRIYVRGGGCHGYQYGMAFESKMSDDDTVIEKGDVKVILHPGLAERPVAGRRGGGLRGQFAGVGVCDQESAGEDHLRVRQFLQRVSRRVSLNQSS